MKIFVLSLILFSNISNADDKFIALEVELISEYLRSSSLCPNYGNSYKLVQKKLKKLVSFSKASDSIYSVEAAVMADSFVDVKRFVEDGGVLETREIMWGSLLHLAAAHSGPQVIEYLISKGIGVDDQHTANGTPLHIAVSNNKIQNIIALLKNGADINAKNGNGGTPIVYTISCKDQTTFKFLLDKGAKINVKVREVARKIGVELDS